MSEKKLHIVSFDNPYPTNYGGIIDVFFKIKALHECGVEIYLHCFVNKIPQECKELEAITTKLFFYKRNKSVINFFSKKPFSVVSRNHKQLIENLFSDNYPILFEGLQTTTILEKINFKNRKIFLRLHNIESKYYLGLSKSENNWGKRIIYYFEAIKYSKYQQNINQFNKVFTLSLFENQWIESKFNNASYVPVFHGNKSGNKLSPIGNYAFYNGDLRISDNIKAANFFIEIFKKIPDYKLIIASNFDNKVVSKKCNVNSNCTFVHLENHKQFEEISESAQINLMISFQQSGTKLKAINALFNSRFCVVNKNIIDDKNVLDLCIIAETETDFIEAINSLKNKPFLDLEKRNQVLNQFLNDKNSAQKIIETIWE